MSRIGAVRVATPPKSGGFPNRAHQGVGQISKSDVNQTKLGATPPVTSLPGPLNEPKLMFPPRDFRPSQFTWRGLLDKLSLSNRVLPSNPAIQTVVSATQAHASGLTITRRYENTSSQTVDQQCQTFAYWSNLVNQVQAQNSYYNSSGTNKFLNKVVFNLYGTGLALPINGYPAYTVRNGSGDTVYSQIYQKKQSPDLSDQGYLSHELGHAYHNWTNCFNTNKPWGNSVKYFFATQYTTSGVGYNPQIEPWLSGNSQGYGNPEEHFANAFRYFLGSDGTRGVSYGNLPTGFKEPRDNPQWKKQMQLLPELTGYFASLSGGGPFNLSWQGGTDGYWQFQNSAGKWMAQTSYYTWHEWNGTQWNRVYPSYNVP